MDNTKKLRTISMCHGYGGIELGLEMAGESISHIAICEIEAFAVDLMVQKMEAGLIDPAPIWTDLKTMPMECFRSRVDLLVAGYPCQPFSSAGARRGTDDPRHLWPYVINWVRVVRPTRCFFENVEGHITLGLSTVLSDLEEAGYQTAWGIFSASEVGAPHQRKRVFILADSTGSGLERTTRESLQRGINGPPCSSEYELADSNGELWGQQTERRIDDSKTGSTGEAMADTDSRGSWEDLMPRELRTDRTKQSSRDCRCSRQTEGLEIQKWPSRPGEPQHDWEPPRTIDGKLNADWVESLQGLPVGWTGTGNRIDRLRLLGNGVVPQTAALAWKTLNKELNNAKL